MNILRNLSPLLIVALFSVTAGAAQHQSYTDEQIQTIVNHDLTDKQIETVHVEVHDGIVTLTGQVKSAWERDTAIEIARNVHDVKDVKSELTVMTGESDSSLAYRLGATIDYNVFNTMFDTVSGTVKDGVVTLTGWVTMGYKAQEIAKSVSKVPGIKEVHDEIKVLPASPNDDQLRAQLASAIYNEMPELANQRVPPIRIIVNNGRVTLVGVVRNKIDRIRAEHAARGMFGVFSVDNQLQIEES
jgi:osmotically-inducible protein OsmY